MFGLLNILFERNFETQPSAYELAFKKVIVLRRHQETWNWSLWATSIMGFKTFIIRYLVLLSILSRALLAGHCSYDDWSFTKFEITANTLETLKSEVDSSTSTDITQVDPSITYSSETPMFNPPGSCVLTPKNWNDF